MSKTNDLQIRVRRLSDGRYRATCESPKLTVTGNSEESARELCRQIAAQGARFTGPATAALRDTTH